MSQVPHSAAAAISSAVADNLITVSDIHINASQTVIVTTEDKVRICLMDHVPRLVDKSAWALPLGVLISMIAALLTADFRDFVLPSIAWATVFAVAALISAWFLIVAWRAGHKASSVEAILDGLKVSAIRVEVGSRAEDGP